MNPHRENQNMREATRERKRVQDQLAAAKAKVQACQEAWESAFDRRRQDPMGYWEATNAKAEAEREAETARVVVLQAIWEQGGVVGPDAA